MKERFASCDICGHSITAKYRTIYCPFCNRIIALQKKIDKMPAEKKRLELARYRRIVEQFRMSLSYEGHKLGTFQSARLIILRSSKRA